MKYIKTYKLFESVSVELDDFPVDEDIKQYFYDITDEDWHYHYYVHNEPSYILFTKYPGLKRDTKSQLLYDISFEENWINKEVDLLGGDKWSEFITTADYDGHLYPEIFQVENDFYKKIYEEALKGTIKIYPLMNIHITLDKPDKMFECLERLYQSTGFRPLGDYKEEDFVDEDDGSIVTLHIFDLKLCKVNDIEYKRLIKGSFLSAGLNDKYISTPSLRNKNYELTSKFL